MKTLLALACLLLQPAAEDSPPEHVLKYLERCQQAKAALIAAKDVEIKALERKGDAANKVQCAKEQLAILKQQSAALAPLPLPPSKGGVGTFEPARLGDARDGRSTDVLEVVDDDDAIIRAWYVPPDDQAPAKATFVDLWVHGLDTSSLKAGKRAHLTQVFEVTGNQTFATTCGGRSIPLVEPIDVGRYSGER